jgi:hypothetical protein
LFLLENDCDHSRSSPTSNLVRTKSLFSPFIFDLPDCGESVDSILRGELAMLGLIMVVSALILVGLLVWFQVRVAPLPPNARLLLDLWASLEKESVSSSPIKDKHGAHCRNGEGQSTI